MRGAVPVPERPVLVAPDSFKGTIRATEVAAAVARGLERAGLMPPDRCPVADGGEGTLEVLLTALGGRRAAPRSATRSGARWPPGSGCWRTAAPPWSRWPPRPGSGSWPPTSATPGRRATRGTGELICAAVDAGAEVVLVAVGGSATTDGGAGALEAIAEHGGLGGARVVVLCDVRTPWERAPAVFGPQKGADPATVERLEARLDELAGRLAREHRRDPRGVPLTGAAGGLSGGLWAGCGAVLEPGAPFVLDALEFDRRMRASRCVVTGEGKLDEQTLQGKIVGEIGTRTRQGGVPLHAIVGTDALDGFGKRMIDLQVVLTATTLPELEAAGEALGRRLAEGTA